MDEAGTTPDATREPTEWVEAYGDYLYRYAFSRLRDGNAAEEAVQETFLAGIRFIDQFSGDGSQRAWLLGILKRKIVDHVRQRTRYDRDGAGDDNPDFTGDLFDAKGFWKPGAAPWSNSPDSPLEAEELWAIVRKCLETLPKGQADVFVLSVMEELAGEEICNELEITPSNLWVRLHRARLGLARCVGSRWGSSAEVLDHAE